MTQLPYQVIPESIILMLSDETKARIKQRNKQLKAVKEISSTIKKLQRLIK